MQLPINKPADEYEREADHVSEQVMRMPEPQRPDHERLRTGRVQAGETGQIATPPIVGEVLRSPGQPLEPAARDFMERRFGHDFGRIRIHTDPPAARASAAFGAEAFTVGHHIAFARGRFMPGAAHGRRLVAHELTHSIQQAATSPHIALSPEKERAAPAPGSLKFDGVLLGINRDKKEVRVRREVGGTQGYDGRLQAIAVARLAKAEPAAVVLGKDGKWHALETTAGFQVGRVSANDPKASETVADGNVPFVEVHGLPSLTGIDQSRQKSDELKAKLVRLDALEQEWRSDPEFRKAVKGSDKPFLTAVQEERDKVNRELNQATQTRAGFVLGVPESEILLSGSLTGRTAGKVNVIGTPGKGSPGGAHNPLGGETGFQEGLASAFSIDLPELDNPARAQAVLFHEVQHLIDWEFAQEWVKNYTTETKRLFVKGAAGRKPFEDWLNAQVKAGRLTKADVELVLMETGDASAYTEAHANVRTFLAALQAGAPDVATEALVGYAYALKPKKEGGGGQYGSPAYGSQVQAALVVELKTAYKKMPKTMQKQYDDAVAAAKAKYPSAWISELEVSKRAGR